MQAILHTASVGAIAGGVFAAREIAAHQYLGQHLWRTSLWIACSHTLLGALLGGAGAAFMVLSLAAWQALHARATGPSDSSDTELGFGVRTESAPRLAARFGLFAAAAILLIPGEAPEVFGVSHWVAVAACIALIWLIGGSSVAKPRDAPEPDEGLPGFSLLWSQVVTLGYIVALTHLWACTWPGWVAVGLAGIGLLAAVALCRCLRHPMGSLAAWLEATTGAAGKAGARAIPAVVMAVIVVLWVAGWVIGVQARARAAQSGVNVIVIAVDTLRWDAVSLVSAEEHDRDLTPNLRKLMSPRATVFSNAYSQAPWTLPAFASIFTGLYPEQHGAEHVWSQLRPEKTTLAELLREQGYLTMSVVSGHFVTTDVGMTQGFAVCDETLAASARAVTSADVTDTAVRFLEARGDQRFFLFAHYFDPHYPYFTHPEVSLEPPRDDELRSPQNEGTGEGWAGPAGRAFAVSGGSLRAYREEVAYADLHIGRLLAYLYQQQLWDETCVIFVSDHGEEFLEHGAVGHDNTLYQELVRVPLAVAAPALEVPGIVEEPVETRWLFETILEVAATRSPGEHGEGPPLLSRRTEAESYMRSSTCPRGRTSVEGGTRPSVWLSCLTGERYKLIADHLRGRTMLFDLLEDPDELSDLSQERPEVAAKLGRALARADVELHEAGVVGASPALTKDRLRRLKSLGYL